MFKKKVVILLLLISPVLIFAHSDIRSVRGFSGGESILKVKSEEGAKLLEEHAEGDFAALLFEDEIFSLPCKVIFFFIDDQLKNMQISFYPEEDENLTEGMFQERFPETTMDTNDLIKMMRSKYGNELANLYHANEDEFLEGTATYYWSFDNLRIEVEYYCDMDFSGNVDIEYMGITYYFNDELEPPQTDFRKF